MSRRLQRLEIPVHPERGMFRVYDAGTDPDGPAAPLPPVGALISVSPSREQVWVGSLQRHVGVRLVLEEWDAAPCPEPITHGDFPGGGPAAAPDDPGEWDEEAKSQLYLRGQLTIDMGPAGIAVGVMRLVGGVGDYSARVYARNRDRVARLYDGLFDTHGDPLGDEFARAKKDLEGIEQYLLQLWRES